MESDTRRNLLAYYLNFSVMAVVGFIINPLLLSALGPLTFGVWKSLQRFLDFATVADGRASQALKWIVAHRTALTDLDKQRDIGAAVIIWFRWLPAAAIVVGAITFAVPLLITGIPTDVLPIAYATAAVLAANTVLAGLLSIPDSVLVGINQGYKSMLVTTAVFVVSNVLMIVAAASGCPLWSLGVIILIAAVVNAGLTLMVAKRSIRWLGVARPTRSDLRRVFGYSAWTLVGALVDKLFLSSELIVVSVMLGAVAVTQYTFTTYVMTFILSIAMMTASGFMPTLGSQLGASQTGDAAERAKSVRHLVVGIAALGGAAVLAFNGAFVTAWAGPDQYLGTGLNGLLVICSLQFMVIRMDGQILDVTLTIASKVLLGLVTSAGGIAAGCLGYYVTHNLGISFLAVIVVRLIGNVALPVLVARSIPGSALPWQPIVLSVLLCGVSFIIGPLAQNGGLMTTLALVVGWMGLAGWATWCGLFPRTVLRALVARPRAEK